MALGILLLLALLTGLLLLLPKCHPKARGHLPPGPQPLPFFGNFLHMGRRGLLKFFLEQRDKYGDIFTVYLGPRPVIILCGIDTIREALVDQAESFSGRGKLAIFDQVFQGYGVIFANGERWRVLRRFSLATMRNFGMGKRSLEERIQEEAQCLVGELRNSQGALQDPTFFFHSITANVICSIVFGERFAYSDPKFLRLLDLFHQTFELANSFSSQMFEFFSFLKYIPGPHNQVYRNMQEVKTFIGRNVDKHRQNLDPSAPQDLIDTFLLRMDKEKSDPGSEFHQTNLIHTVLSLFFAGTESTSATLCYGFLLMLKYPHVAERIHKEIAQVIGSHRPPALADRAKMPYTDAVLHEIQRFADIFPLSGAHMVTKDTYFRGYTIPKGWNRERNGKIFDLVIIPQGTDVFPMLNSAHYDPHYFETPDTFNPDHFLDANGALKKNEAFIPFSIGKRICIGESIANAELFLFFTTILQNFSVASPVAPEDIDITPLECGVSQVPPKYQIRFLSR